MIALESETVARTPQIRGDLKNKAVELNEEQRAAAEDFARRYDQGIRETALVCGVTGSGKTEVYMEMIAHVVSQGKQAIMLIVDANDPDKVRAILENDIECMSARHARRSYTDVNI